MLKEKIRMYVTLLKKENRKNYKKLRTLKGKYKGKRCWVIGNGPSLDANDLEKIKDDYSFAANRIYYIYDKTTWRPNFYMCQDPRAIKNVVEDACEEKKELNVSEIFVSKVLANQLDDTVGKPVFYRLCKSENPTHIHITKNLPVYVVEGLSVTYSMIQFAIYMGFSEICLLGVDHNQNTANEKNVESLHFDKRYKVDLASYPTVTEYEYLTSCFKKAKEECERKGIRIYNATRGGMLEVFERRAIETILGGDNGKEK